MTCRKCKKELPEGAVFCCWCGAKQEAQKKPRRANGEGCILPHGNGYMVILRKRGADGKYISKSKCGFKTQREARAYVPELKKALSRPGSLPENITFARLYDRWVPFYENRVSEGEMKSAASAYKHFASIHNFVFADVTTQQMQDCMDACGRGKRTRENMKLLARRLYSYAIGERIVSVNYAAELYCGNEKKGKRPPFTMEEIAAIDRAEREGMPYADYVLVMIYTGFRPTEFLTLTAESYDARARTLRAGIKSQAGRGGPEELGRIVPVHPRIQAIVGRCVARGGVLFPGPDGKAMTDETFRIRCFQPLMDALGIKDRVPYSSRHSFANFLKRPEKEKIADRDIIALMGHSEKAQTIYYQTADIDGLRAIIDAFPVLNDC